MKTVYEKPIAEIYELLSDEIMENSPYPNEIDEGEKMPYETLPDENAGTLSFENGDF